MLYVAIVTFCVGSDCFEKQYDFEGLMACTLMSQRAAGDYVRQNPMYTVKRIRCKPSDIAERLRERYK